MFNASCYSPYSVCCHPMLSRRFGGCLDDTFLLSSSRLIAVIGNKTVLTLCRRLNWSVCFVFEYEVAELPCLHGSYKLTLRTFPKCILKIILQTLLTMQWRLGTASEKQTQSAGNGRRCLASSRPPCCGSPGLVFHLYTDGLACLCGLSPVPTCYT